MSTALIFQVQSFLILTLMGVGIYFKRNRSLHVKIMGSAIAWDVLLILQIELSRSAIVKASKAMSNTMMLNIHVSLAVLCVLFYIAMVLSGRKILAGDNQYRSRHKLMGMITFVIRILVFVTSFWAVRAS